MSKDWFSFVFRFCQKVMFNSSQKSVLNQEDSYKKFKIWFKSQKIRHFPKNENISWFKYGLVGRLYLNECYKNFQRISNVLLQKSTCLGGN